MSNEPDQMDMTIQAAIKHHTPLFYIGWKASGHQLASRIKPENEGGNPYGDRWSLYVDMGTGDPGWARSEIAKALCILLNIRELDLVVMAGWTIMDPDNKYREGVAGLLALQSHEGSPAGHT